MDLRATRSGSDHEIAARGLGHHRGPGTREVVLRFHPRVASRVLEATWHPTQTVATEADGSLHWRATVSGTIEIRLWILAWGDDVEVLAPASLRGDVIATHGRAVALYEDERR
jgi:predicted DNA-binding transcriptional regulator YafY